MTNLNKINQRKNICSKLDLPFYTATEEILNSITHGLGVILSIIAFILFIKDFTGDNIKLTCGLIYSFALLILYSVSTIYHGLKINLSKKVFRILDHCSIFLLIAGTYTPIAIISIGGAWGIIIISAVWSVAILGIILNIIDLKKFAKFSMTCYITMGWAALIAIKPILNNFSNNQVWVFFIGGILYTIGAIIYGKGKNIKYAHFIWHLFVLVGSIFHFILIYSLYGCGPN
ncbi:MAG: hemolysin III family protein [Oscillospiraceae bacterium]|nr:hemolysin III family protein [Oscillospiraceae bacterium]